jgi:exodeoxyribonuclease-5
MLKNHIITTITKHLEFDPTPGQAKLINKLAEFIINKRKNEVFLINGYAGTGKTRMISAIVRALYALKHKSVLLAPTGRAAKVLASYTGHKAFTIHKKIYRQHASKDGFGHFSLDENLHTNTFFIVDEASMISNQPLDISVFGSGYLLNDLLTYVHNDKNCRLIIVGDVAQLPPVKLNVSPALKSKTYEQIGYTYQGANLTEVIRQEKESGILHNATIIRRLIEKKEIELPKFKTEGYADIVRLNGNEMAETITDAYDQYGMDQTIIINRSNKNSNNYNFGIRQQILWREDELMAGDYLMVVKNNYYWLPDDENDLDFIANGDIGEIVKISGAKELYGYRFADVILRLIDHEDVEIEATIMLDTLYMNTPSLPGDKQKAFFYQVMEDYADTKTKKAQYRKVLTNPYYNALQVKFAYAVTCHKAQGGQWKAVFIDQGYMTEDMVNMEYLRWLYTAVTRATEKLFLVNFNEKFFYE